MSTRGRMASASFALFLMALLPSLPAGFAAGRAEQETATTTGRGGPPAMGMTMWYRGAVSIVMPTAPELMVRRIKEKLNVDLKIDFVDKGGLQEKLNLMFASGDYPDIVGGVYDMGQVAAAVSNGVFIPIEDSLARDPAWSSLPTWIYKATTFNGKRYSVPFTTSAVNVIYYRYDWMKKVGAKEPNTFEDFEAMLRAFTLKDPDGNGLKDTYGIGFLPGFGIIDPLEYYFLPAHFGAFYLDPADDTIKNTSYLVEDTKRALSWFRKIYSEGILDPQWVVLKDADTQAKFNSGIYGAYIRGAQFLMVFGNKIIANTPNAVLSIVPTWQGKYGSNHRISDKLNTGYFLTKACKDPARGAQVLMYFFGNEGTEIFTYGEEGKTFEAGGGTFRWLTNEAKAMDNSGNIRLHSFNLTDKYKMTPKSPDPMLDAALKNVTRIAALPDISSLLVQSEAAKLRSVDLNTLTQQFFTQVVIGEKSLDDYGKYLEEFKKAGADKILEEANALYRKSK